MFGVPIGLAKYVTKFTIVQVLNWWHKTPSIGIVLSKNKPVEARRVSPFFSGIGCARWVARFVLHFFPFFISYYCSLFSLLSIQFKQNEFNIVNTFSEWGESMYQQSACARLACLILCTAHARYSVGRTLLCSCGRELYCFGHRRVRSAALSPALASVLGKFVGLLTFRVCLFFLVKQSNVFYKLLC